MSDLPKLRKKGEWEKIKAIEEIIRNELDNESVIIWAAEAIYKYVNRNPVIAAEYIIQAKADAWDECAASARGDIEAELTSRNPYR